MNKTFALSLFAACASFVMIGCGAAGDEALDEDERLGTAEQAQLAEDPPEGDNHFGSMPFWADDSQAAYRIMGAGALDQGNGYLPELEISPDYRAEVLRNAIECGLGQDQEVIDPKTNERYRGHWGIAPLWEDAELTASERRYVTACMAQRLNAFELPIGILLEGRNQAINMVPALDAKYAFDESTVWGDLFSSETPLDAPETPGIIRPPPFNLYACWDDELDGICVGADTPENWLNYRICDESDVCGLTVLGRCADVCTVSFPGYHKCPVPGGTFIETVHVQLPAGTCHSPP